MTVVIACFTLHRNCIVLTFLLHELGINNKLNCAYDINHPPIKISIKYLTFFSIEGFLFPLTHSYHITHIFFIANDNT